jgi:hypothetical protein
MKKWFGYSSLRLSNRKMHSTEKDPRSTKSPLNNYSQVKEKKRKR